MTRRTAAWKTLNEQVIQCDRCPRLLEHCQHIAEVRRRAYQDFPYWGGPVPNFGDPGARLLIIGLAPGAHGANRTGRMFTGDRSGDWLYRALHKSGFASQPESTTVDDGMRLKGCAITNVCHCAPPGNRPTVDEIQQCSSWLTDLVTLLPVHVFLALGQIGWKATIDYLIAEQAWTGKRPKFGHGATVQLEDGRWLIGSYHPSQQNTFTKRLTEPMFDSVFRKIKKLLAKQSSP
ncbi:MAG: uracil-DNA glycosylase [Planctomycetota bacterium]|nr:uracil-DNA glycosylase [Planctomycetota bacterium]